MSFKIKNINIDNTKKAKVKFYTLGCKVNQYETGAMITDFVNHGYQVVESEDNLDIIVINTCTVTNMADRKSRQLIHKAKKDNPNAVIICTGCLAQTNEKDKLDLQYIDILIGNEEKHNIIEILEEYIKDNKLDILIDVKNISDINEYEEFAYFSNSEKTRKSIKIQDGCNMFCTYCIIPYTRGRIRSRNKVNILNEIKEVADSGIKEVVLTGIHISSYGLDLKENYSLIDLIEDISKIDKIERIRLGSLEPTIITDEFLTRLKDNTKLCHHFHLSLQSACNTVLKRMNRKYTINQYIDIVEKLRKVFTDVIITTDIIVGFPGETDEEFMETYANLEKLKLYFIHIFKYSARKGTIAASMKNMVNEKIKKERSTKLFNLVEKIKLEYLNNMKNQETEVLIEQELDNKYYMGHSKNFIEILIDKKELEEKYGKKDYHNRNISCIGNKIYQDKLICNINEKKNV